MELRPYQRQLLAGFCGMCNMLKEGALRTFLHASLMFCKCRVASGLKSLFRSRRALMIRSKISFGRTIIEAMTINCRR